MQLGHHLVSMLVIFISSIKQFKKDLYLNNLKKNLCQNIRSLRKHPILLQPKHCWWGVSYFQYGETKKVMCFLCSNIKHYQCFKHFFLMCKVSWLYDQCFLPRPGFICCHALHCPYTAIPYIGLALLLHFHGLQWSYTAMPYTGMPYTVLSYSGGMPYSHTFGFVRQKASSRATWKQMINTPTFKIVFIVVLV